MKPTTFLAFLVGLASAAPHAIDEKRWDDD
jgi:hypothetical protein